MKFENNFDHVLGEEASFFGAKEGGRPDGQPLLADRQRFAAPGFQKLFPVK